MTMNDRPWWLSQQDYAWCKVAEQVVLARLSALTARLNAESAQYHEMAQRKYLWEELRIQ